MTVLTTVALRFLRFRAHLNKPSASANISQIPELHAATTFWLTLMVTLLVPED